MDRLLNSKSLARIALALGGLVCAIGMVGPFQGVEKALIPWDKAAHFVAFYGVTLLMFSAFPGRRRIDLFFLAVLAGSGIEIAQAMTGRDAELGDVLADALGAMAVLAPVYLEFLRRKPETERRRSASLTELVSSPAVETA